jgi:hypothetical protein
MDTADGGAAQPDTSWHHAAVPDGLFGDPALGGLLRRDVI